MPIMPCEVLITKRTKRVCKSSANSLQLYELLFVLSLATSKKRPHTLQCALTLFAFIYSVGQHLGPC